MKTQYWLVKYAQSALTGALVALIAGCGGYGGGGSYMTPTTPTTTTTTVTVPAELLTLTKMTTIGPTADPTHKEVNPYGLTVATATSGLVTKGDLIVCNFNDAAGTQGTGTTIVGLHPTAGATPYLIAQSSMLLLGCSALTSLPDGSLVATASQAPGQVHATVLVTTSGMISTPFSPSTPPGTFAEPWSVIYATHMGSEAVYVSNAMTGTIDRIGLNGDAQASFTEIASGFSVNNGVPGNILAPAGLTYDASADTLYVVDGNATPGRVVALANVSAIGTDGVIVSGATFTGASAASAKVIFSGAPLNGPISGALLSNGNLLVGNTLDPNMTNLLIEISPKSGTVVATKNVDTGNMGAIFGIVAVPTTITTMSGYTTTQTQTDLVYFNDDNTNMVVELSQ